MEHLPIPHDATPDLEEVPYVCTEEYAGQDFLTYPLRKGKPWILGENIKMETPYMVHESMFPSEKQDIEAFMQTWLFFGLLHVMLGDLFHPQDFIKTSAAEPTRKVISTAKLQDLTNLWTQKVRALEKSASKSLFEYLSHCIELAWKSWAGTKKSKMNSAIRRSIAANAEFLTSVLDFAHLQAFPGSQRAKKPFAGGFYDDNVTKRMLDGGWCRSDIARIQEKFDSIQMLYFLSRMSKPAIFDHHDCKEDYCLALKDYSLTYQTGHRTTGCDCAFLEVDSRVLNQILDNGGIPIVQIIPDSSGDSGEFSIQIRSQEEVKQYVAISHVWADGLGNPSQNSLPKCQLTYLSQILGTLAASCNPPLPHPVSFWIDTLCCPITNPGRNIAIARMRQTYADCTHVLILDRSLTAYKSTNLNHAEISARLLTSPWMRRLWTLQEGALSKSQWIQLDDLPISFIMMGIELYKMHMSRPEYRRLCQEFLYDFQTIFDYTRFLQGTFSKPGVNLWYLDHALNTRITSKGGDEGICIATLMGYDVEKVLQAPIEKRMCVIWDMIASSQSSIPKNIIFLGETTITFFGYRWAPSSLLEISGKWGQKHRALCWTGETGHLTDQGLQAKYPGFHISAVDVDDPWPDLATMQEVRYVFKEEATDLWWMVAYKPTNKGPLSDTPISLLTLAKSGQLAVVLAEEAPVSKEQSSDLGYRQGVTVTFQQETSDGVLRAELGKGVILAPLRPSNALCYEVAARLAKQVKAHPVTKALNDIPIEDAGRREERKTARDAVKAKIRELVDVELDHIPGLRDAVLGLLGQGGHAESLWALVGNWYRAVGSGTRISGETTWCFG